MKVPLALECTIVKTYFVALPKGESNISGKLVLTIGEWRYAWLWGFHFSLGQPALSLRGQNLSFWEHRIVTRHYISDLMMVWFGDIEIHPNILILDRDWSVRMMSSLPT